MAPHPAGEPAVWRDAHRRCAAGSATPPPRAPARRRDAAIRGAIPRSRRPDPKTETAQDRVADHGRRKVAEAHAEDERPRKMNARPAAVDAALDMPRRRVAADQKRGRALPTVTHRRRKEAGADDGHTDIVTRQPRPQRLRISAQPGLARAVARAVGQAA